jgi:hypothetical protein
MDHLTITSREVAGGKVEYSFQFRAGKMGPRGEAPLIYSALQMHRTAVLDRIAKYTYEDPVKSPAEDLKEIGTLIATKLVSLEMNKRLGGIPGPFLHLEVDEEAAKIPWELMHAGGDFLGSRLAVGRTILTAGRAPASAATQPEPAVRPGGPSPFLMLLVGNPSPVPDHEDLPDAIEELRAIQGIAQGLGGQSLRTPVVLHGTDATLMKLEQALEQGARYQIFHFAGHCEFVEDDPNATGLVFPEGILSPSNLAQFFGGLPPRVIFVNACESAKSRARPTSDIRNRLTLPQGFIEAGVEAFVGCLWRVEDQAVRQISAEFYGQALAGKPIGIALKEAKSKVDSPWMSRAAYLMYGDPTTVLSGPRPDFVLLRLADGERGLRLISVPGAGLALERLNGERFLLPAKASLTMGRKRPTPEEQGADIVLRLGKDEETVQLGRIHLELQLGEDGQLAIVDHSKTGTIVNGARVRNGARIPLIPGSTLGLVALDPAAGRGSSLLDIVVLPTAQAFQHDSMSGLDSGATIGPGSL